MTYAATLVATCDLLLVTILSLERTHEIAKFVSNTGANRWWQIVMNHSRRVLSRDQLAEAFLF